MHKRLAGIAVVLVGIAFVGGYVLIQIDTKPEVVEPVAQMPVPVTPSRESTTNILKEAVEDTSTIRTLILNRTTKSSDGSTHTYVDGYTELSDDTYGPYLEIEENTITIGNADGDDKPDAFAIELYNAGGTGDWYSLLYFEDVETNKARAIQIELDDDVGVVNGITITPGQVALDIYYRGPGDPNCCSSKHRSETYTVKAGVLTKVFTTELGDRPRR